MATAGICSEFSITIEGADLDVAKAFVAPRAFIIRNILATNEAAGAGTLTVSKTVGVTTTAITGTTAAPPVAGAGDVQAQAVAGPVSNVCVIAANASVPAGATVTVLASAATIPKVVLQCVGVDQSLSIA